MHQKNTDNLKVIHDIQSIQRKEIENAQSPNSIKEDYEDQIKGAIYHENRDRNFHNVEILEGVLKKLEAGPAEGQSPSEFSNSIAKEVYDNTTEPKVKLIIPGIGIRYSPNLE